MIETRVYEAASKLQSPELKAFYDWLVAEKAATVERLILAESNLAPVLQGEARRLNTILNLIETAQSVLDKKRA